MTHFASLPPGFVLRRAEARDRQTITRLLSQFRQEVVPPAPATPWLNRAIAAGIVTSIGLYVVTKIGTKEFIRFMLGSAIVAGAGALVVAALTWNDAWCHFWVIEHNSCIVACAKLRQYDRYSVLFDLFVLPEWRGRGLGSSLVEHLGHQANKPLYLACLPPLVQFYIRLGFAPISPKKLPPLLQYDLGISGRFNIVPLALESVSSGV